MKTLGSDIVSRSSQYTYRGTMTVSAEKVATLGTNLEGSNTEWIWNVGNIKKHYRQLQ